MVKYPDSEFDDGAFSASSGVVSASTRRNERTDIYSWANSRDENGNAIENNITEILETDYRYSPHLT
jgi:hypothetical protein